VEYKLIFEKPGYIAHPYWPEREQVVNIQKQSGMNRARSEDKRDAALRRYLEKLGLTMADYKKLEVAASNEWYRNASGHIVIPRHHLSGCLVQACKSSPAGTRFSQDQLRCLLQIADFTTDRKTADGIFERFVLPTDGKGNPISNQRRLTKNEFIAGFTAGGTIDFDKSDVSEKAVRELLQYAGKYVGVGASRKMGYGRFKVA